MIIKVTVDKVTVIDDVEVHEGEYKVNKCVFDFSEEYTNDLVKKAVFIGENKTPYTKVIANNECDIPAELLVKSQLVLVGVYAYKVNNDDLVLRYSPTPTQKFITTGSYKEDEVPSEEITPSQFEQYQQALQDGLNEVASSLEEMQDLEDTVSSNEETRQENESTRQTNETARIGYYEYIQEEVQEGNFDGATFIPSVDAEGNISWSNDKGKENPQTQNIRGPQGVAGPQGEAFTIKKTYSSIAEMQADFDNMNVGDYVMIASTVEVEDNAKLYTKTEREWVFITDFSGATGIQGERGPQGIQRYPRATRNTRNTTVFKEKQEME